MNVVEMICGQHNKNFWTVSYQKSFVLMTISFEKQYTGNEEKPYEKRKTGKYVIMIFATKISRKSGQHAGTRELSSRACSKQKVGKMTRR